LGNPGPRPGLPPGSVLETFWAFCSGS